MPLVVEFKPAGVAVVAKEGTSLLDAATAAGVHLEAPCGGQGRCGRCKVRVESGRANGALHYRSNARLAPAEEAKGYRLGCQTFVGAVDEKHAQGEERVVVSVPRPRKKRLRQLGHAGARPEALPATSTWRENPAIRTFALEMEPPSLEDNTSDLDRLRRELARQHGVEEVRASLDIIRQLGRDLRAADWNVSVTVDTSDRDRGVLLSPRVLATNPARTRRGEYGLAVDVGTTSVVVYLVQLGSGRVVDSAGAYNAQIACGDDVISRIVYSQRGQGLARLQQLVVETINELIDELLARTAVRAVDIYEMMVAGNTVMTHLLLGVDPKYLREEPYIPTLATAPPLLAGELGLKLNPRARVSVMPSIGSWVGGDITAGVISSGLYTTDKLTLFMDIGTNGEIVLGTSDWLIACACSAGPAFEGGGVTNGMRATSGAIEDIWIDATTLEPTFRTIDDAPPQGLCGSGLIELLAELLITSKREGASPATATWLACARAITAWSMSWRGSRRRSSITTSCSPRRTSITSSAPRPPCTPASRCSAAASAWRWRTWSRSSSAAPSASTSTSRKPCRSDCSPTFRWVASVSSATRARWEPTWPCCASTCGTRSATWPAR